MTTVVNKKRPAAAVPAPDPNEPKITTNMTIPESLVRRMATYIYEKHQGRSHLRNKLILVWIDKALREEGY